MLTISVLGAAVLAVGTPAHATAINSDATHKVCTTVVAPVAPGEKSSRVLHQSCTTETLAASAQRRADKRGPLDSTLLVVFWEEVDFGGDESQVYGSDGTCNGSGYGFEDMEDVQDETGGVSSYQLQGNCDVSEKFTETDFGGTSSGLIFGQSQSWVGSTWNDGGIQSFWTLDG